MAKLKMLLKVVQEIHSLERKLLLCALSSAVTTALIPFVNIWFSSKLIDILDKTRNNKELIFFIVFVISINFILLFAHHYLNDMYNIKRNIMYNAERKKIAQKLYSIEYQKLEDSDFKNLIHKHSEAQNRVYSAFTQFTWMIKDFTSGFITLTISIFLLLPLFKIGFTRTGDSFFEKPIFLISILIIIVVMAIIALLISTRLNKEFYITGNKYSKLDRLFHYYLDMFGEYKTAKEIRLYNEQLLIKHSAVDVILTDGEKLLKENSIQTAKSSSTIALLGSLLGFGIYLFVGIKGYLGLFSISSLIVYCGSFMQIINGVIKMASTFGQMAEIIPLVNYYFEIINTENSMHYGNLELDTNIIDIEFKNVYFKYPGTNNYVLENINFTMRNGEHIAVVGKNGSGKTTFIKLMCRLYDVTDGEVLINNKNIKMYSKESLTKLYSVVFQDFQMFALPLFENVSAGENYDKEKLYSCLDESDIKDRVVKLPQKELTYIYRNIDKDGVEISGGEAQKLALARALYKNSQIIILDEPTAALDPIAENEVYNRFNSFANNKSAIYISHRLSSCVFCDRVVVLEKAKIIQTGTHEELLKNKKGSYYKLWNAQAQHYIY